MSRLLVQLLGVDERNFRTFIDRLERICLNPSIDIRLSAEIISKTREKARELGLDSVDTTAKELFYALKGRLIEDDNRLKSILKIDNKSAEQSMKILAKTATKLSKKELALCMTTAGTRRVLLAVPPRKTLRALKLRSIESVLKREDPKLVYAIAAQFEDASWKSQVHAKMKRLPSKDIEWQSVEVIQMSSAWLEKILEKVHHHGFQIVCPEVGAVVLLPVIPKFSEGVTILSLCFILQAAQRLAVEGMPYRRQGFMQGYHNLLPEIAHGQQAVLDSMHGLAPSWRAVHELIAKGFLLESQPEVELVLNELDWQSTEMKLSTIVPNIDFWVDTHYLAVKTDSKPVSLHIMDVARAVVVKSELGNQSVTHLEGSLWNELQIRYLQQDALAKSLTQQLRANTEDVVL